MLKQKFSDGGETVYEGTFTEEGKRKTGLYIQRKGREKDFVWAAECQEVGGYPQLRTRVVKPVLTSINEKLQEHMRGRTGGAFKN